jgi:hypothetical protein
LNSTIDDRGALVGARVEAVDAGDGVDRLLDLLRHLDSTISGEAPG